jgi:preprotein translocase subunit SecF
MNFGKFHDKYYKHLLLIPALLFVFSFIYLGIFYSQTGEFFIKDISLSGGTSATITGNNLNINQLEEDLSSKLEDLNVKNVYDIISMEQKAVILETKTDADTTKKVLEYYLGYKLNEDNSSFEYTGDSLSDSFYQQLLIAVLFAFLLMSIVVFIQFRIFIPSVAVIISAFADILMALVVVNIFGIKLSSAGIVAFLMLIGYSVDTDILLTTRLLKRGQGDLNPKIYEAFKTGMTMTLTSILAISFALVLVHSFSAVLSQIFIILLIGLIFDLLNTWLTNVSILKWYVLRRDKQ